MEDINNYLAADADEEDRAAARQLEEGFAALRLKEKVELAAIRRAQLQRSNRLRMLLLLVVLLPVLALIGYQGWKKARIDATEPTNRRLTEDPVPPDPPTELTEPMLETEEEEPPVIEEVLESREEAPTPPPENVPIAQAPPVADLPPPPYGAPATYLRGQAEEAAGKERLDQLWYTAYPLTGLAVDSVYAPADALLRERKFPLAYVNLQRLDRKVPPNDTLRYLTAYTLMEMGQGAEALALLEQLEAPAPAWADQIQWYRGIASLLDRQLEPALGIFRDIERQSGHRYHKQAEKALLLYE